MRNKKLNEWLGVREISFDFAYYTKFIWDKLQDFRKAHPEEIKASEIKYKVTTIPMKNGKSFDIYFVNDTTENFDAGYNLYYKCIMINAAANESLEDLCSSLVHEWCHLMDNTHKPLYNFYNDYLDTVAGYLMYMVSKTEMSAKLQEFNLFVKTLKEIDPSYDLMQKTTVKLKSGPKSYYSLLYDSKFFEVEQTFKLLVQILPKFEGFKNWLKGLFGKGEATVKSLCYLYYQVYLDYIASDAAMDRYLYHPDENFSAFIKSKMGLDDPNQTLSDDELDKLLDSDISRRIYKEIYKAVYKWFKNAQSIMMMYQTK